ncbi:Integral membrane protein [Rhodobacter sp. AKP1]|nr:Integral membrane protein [Rhodobacter sp. AKP1]
MTTASGKSTISYFTWAFAFTVAGLALGGFLGWQTTGTIEGTATIFFICCVLAVLEISLSFDNAIVNANKLKTMTPEWQHRFLTWGIIIAVFGMRIIFPLLIVVIAANLGPWEALKLAATQPAEYSRIMYEAHTPIAAFGGTFLMMVGLTYFFDQEKDIHWVRWIEEQASRYSSIRGVEVAVVLCAVLGFSRLLEGAEQQVFINSALYGLLTFLLVEVLGGFLDHRQQALDAAAKGGFGAFLYLEVLDASFSFDGVIGAFALSQNLFVIAIGLGIGAMYVRSMTIMLVERGTLAQYRYLEHGAFYAILILSVIMYVQTLTHIPEVITGLGGAGLIGISLWSSIRWNRQHAGELPEAEAAPR